jgi:hypothetical protein
MRGDVTGDVDLVRAVFDRAHAAFGCVDAARGHDSCFAHQPRRFPLCFTNKAPRVAILAAMPLWMSEAEQPVPMLSAMTECDHFDIAFEQRGNYRFACELALLRCEHDTLAPHEVL